MGSLSSSQFLYAEIDFLLTGKFAKSSLVDQFMLKLDKNAILRCQGVNSSLPLSSNEPVILPSKHYFVTLLILDAHYRLKHSVVNNTLSELREQYWILKGRQTVKRIYVDASTFKSASKAYILFYKSAYSNILLTRGSLGNLLLNMLHGGVDFGKE